MCIYVERSVRGGVAPGEGEGRGRRRLFTGLERRMHRLSNNKQTSAGNCPYQCSFTWIDGQTDRRTDAGNVYTRWLWCRSLRLVSIGSDLLQRRPRDATIREYLDDGPHQRRDIKFYLSTATISRQRRLLRAVKVADKCMFCPISTVARLVTDNDG